MAETIEIRIQISGVGDRPNQVEAVEGLRFGPSALFPLARLGAEAAEDQNTILRLAAAVEKDDA